MNIRYRRIVLQAQLAQLELGPSVRIGEYDDIRRFMRLNDRRIAQLEKLETQSREEERKQPKRSRENFEGEGSRKAHRFPTDRAPNDDENRSDGG